MEEPIIQLASVQTEPMGGGSAQPNPPKFDKTKLILPGAILIAAMLISGTVLYTRSQYAAVGDAGATPPAKNVKVSVDDDAVLGNANAPVTIIEFSDFQCPFCRKFREDTFDQLKKDYIDTGKVKLVYRDFPLSNIHPSAEIAAEASECAHEQGKYWEYHDVMFSEQAKSGVGTVTFGTTELKRWATQIGLNANQFNQCLDSHKYKDEVAKDQADGVAAGVNGTPTFYINGTMVVGAQPYSVFQATIDEALKAAKK